MHVSYHIHILSRSLSLHTDTDTQTNTYFHKSDQMKISLARLNHVIVRTKPLKNAALTKPLKTLTKPLKARIKRYLIDGGLSDLDIFRITVVRIHVQHRTCCVCVCVCVCV
jgi:hypothetical protein